MSYERKSGKVQAIQLIAPIYDEAGNKKAAARDWLVIEGGKQFYIKNEDFWREFKPAEDKPIVIKEKEYLPYIPCTPNPPWVNPFWYDSPNRTGDVNPYVPGCNTQSTLDCVSESRT
jgi:hypothetical protein